jgi:hypothetical protein
MRERFCWLTILVSTICGTGFSQCSQTITNPAEYNSYIAAASTCSSRPFHSTESALRWEEFIRLYPASAQKEIALQVLLVSYYRSGSSDKLLSTAERLLQLNPNSFPALAVLTYTKGFEPQRAVGANSGREEATSYAKRGLRLILNVAEDKCEVEMHCIAQFSDEVFRAQDKDTAEQALNGMMEFLLLRFCNIRPQVN